jgi:hypothetical protein
MHSDIDARAQSLAVAQNFDLTDERIDESEKRRNER